MDPEYDMENAKKCVEAAANTYDARIDNDTKSVSTIETADYQVMYIDQPKSWRLYDINNIDKMEEVFQIHGVLCASDLPPIRGGNISQLRSKALCLRQAVRLTGLNTASFNNTMSQIDNIFNHLNSYLTNTIPLHWEPATYEGHKALDINARYFTLRKNVPQERGQTFEIGVDPHGVLASIRNQNIIHGDDNKVKYLTEYIDHKGNANLTRTDPSNFHIGDVVRATVSFVIFPSKDNSAIMTLVLKALTLVESMRNFTGVEPTRNIQRAAVIKRKVIFEEEREIREGVAKMNINDGINDSDED